MESGSTSDRDQRLHQVLAAYYEAAETGDAPDRCTLEECHPDLAADLAAFFAAQDRVRELAAPFRASACDTDELDRGFPKPDGERGDPAPFEAGRVFGDYELVSEIAHGGMGIVYRARQQSLNRLVALKVMRGGAGVTSDDARRFQNEARVVATLDHPNIVPIHEVGEHHGCWFFSMKLIEGGSLTDHLLADWLDDRGSARMLAAVARAIHHAHERGFLHRDLKPSNFLIDGRGEPLVADFGLARRVEGDNNLTESGAVLGTPAFMAPEQADGRKGAVSIATDVHGLGALLYTVLAGRPPFQGETPLATLDQVREEDPSPPSTIRQAVDHDLETICLKCLEKNPGRRYATAAEVAEDLDRWLVGEPIAARRVGPAERAWRLCRGHPRMMILVAASLILLVTNVVGLVLETRARTIASRLAQEARGSGRALRAEQYARNIKVASHSWADNHPDQAREVLDRLHPASGEEDLRGFAWHYFHRLSQMGRPPLQGHQGEVYCAAFSPDGKVLATAGQDRTIRLWDPRTGETRSILRGHGDEVNWVSWSPDGRTLATASDDQTVKLWDVPTGQVLATLIGHGEPVVASLFSPDGRQVVSGGRTKKVIVWDAATSREIRSFDVTNSDLQGLAISPDAATVALAGHGAILRNLADGRVLARLERRAGQARCVTYSHDGTLLATCGRGGDVELWAAGTGTQIALFPTRDSELRSVAFSPDDRTLAVVGVHGSIYLIDRPTSVQESIASGHDWLWCVAYSPDGQTLVTVSGRSTVKLWDLARDRTRTAVPIPTARISSFAFSNDGVTIAVADDGGRAWIHDVRSGQLEATYRFVAGSPTCRAVLSSESRSLVTSATSGTITLWELPSGHRLRDVATATSPRNHLVISPDGRWIAQPNQGDAVFLWRRDGSGPPKRIEVLHGGDLIISPRGDCLSIWGWGAGRPTLWENSTGKPRTSTSTGHRDLISVQAFSHDGSILATGGSSGMIILWNGESLNPMEHLSAPSTAVTSMAFSPDNRTLAAGHEDRLVRLWDITTGRELATLEGHSGPVVQVGFSPDGFTLATCAEAGGGSELFLWPATPGR